MGSSLDFIIPGMIRLSDWARFRGLSWYYAWELAMKGRLRLPDGRKGAFHYPHCWLVYREATYTIFKTSPKSKPRVKAVTLPGPFEPWYQGKRVKRIETGLGPPIPKTDT